MTLTKVAIDDGAFLTTYDGGSLSRTTILWAQEEWLRHVVTACTYGDSHAVETTLVACTTPLTHLAQSGV